MTHDPRPTTPIAPGRYCRDVESYLCRQNDGHLVRIVGPAFELVCGWAERQIPLRIVCGAIDRTRARHDAKRRSSPSGQSRRPLRIEFCEDVSSIMGVSLSERFPLLAVSIDVFLDDIRFTARGTTEVLSEFARS